MTYIEVAHECGLHGQAGDAKARKIALKKVWRLREAEFADLADKEIELLEGLYQSEVNRERLANAPELPGIEPDPIPSPFAFEGKRLRVIDQKGEPWFVGKDVCEALEIKNASEAISRLDKDERSTIGNSESRNGGGQLLIISESGLYSLILRCQGATTEGSNPWRFKRWVTHEVLPALRKTGEYKAPGAKKSEPPKPTKAVKLPAGAQLREMRLMGEKGLLSARQIQRLLGVEEPPIITLEVEKASPAFAERAFGQLNLIAKSGPDQASPEAHL